MVEFKKNNMRRKALLLSLWAVSLLSACSELEIPVYQEKDSSLYFSSLVQEFSLKGNAEPEVELSVPLIMTGPVCDYDRPVSIEVVDTTINTATVGLDVTIEEAVVRSGQSKGFVKLKVKNLGADVPSKRLMLRIALNEFFQRPYANNTSSEIVWTAEYARPSIETVWKSWFYFFSPSYSKAYHKLLVDYFGPDLEKSSYESKAIKDTTLIYKAQTWWYSASRDFYQFVKEHDQANPEEPYMHSSDYEKYSRYTLPVGQGDKPETPPTVLSTLLVH